MKTVTASIATLTLAILAGCSTTGAHYVSDTAPTLSSVKAAGGSQLYKGSLIQASDFDASGQARGLSDYNLAAESAPCSALGDFYVKQDKPLGQFFAADVNGKRLTLNCRPTNGAGSPTRLYLLGSSADCQARNGFTSSVYVGKAYHDFHQSCAGYRVSGGQETQVDRDYKGRS